MITINRNVESHFSRLPNVQHQRSVFDRSSTHKTSFNAGELIPVYVDEVLPGDTFAMSTSKVVRMQTLLTPIMDNVYLDMYWFFVPNRLVWDHWQEFCGENTQSAWIPSTSYIIPHMTFSTAVARGSIMDYMGIGSAHGSINSRISALPFRAYGLICNEFFRDQNLTDPIDVYTGDAAQAYNSADTNYITCTSRGGWPFKVAKYHDYFTSCLPAPQKGQPVGAPIDGVAAVTTSQEFLFKPFTSASYPLLMADTTVAPPFPTIGPSDDRTTHRNSSGALYNTATVPTANTPLYPTNLIVDSSLGGNLNIDINNLRLAVASQRYLEQLARAGSRYTEMISSFFGVTSPDSRLQRPEYLGGNRIPIQIHQVSNTAQSQTDFLGDLGANSVTSDHHGDFVHSFTEHGYLLGLCCVRYDHTYSQGIERMWTRRNFLDFYLPTFANIGEQPVYNYEIYNSNSAPVDDLVFGYQEAWADYRYKPSRVSGYMRPNIAGGLGSWHLADNYASVPTLSDGWIREDKTNIDRTLAVTSAASDQFFADFYFDCKCTRVMPMYSIPGMLDHN